MWHYILRCQNVVITNCRIRQPPLAVFASSTSPTSRCRSRWGLRQLRGVRWQPRECPATATSGRRWCRWGVFTTTRSCRTWGWRSKTRSTCRIRWFWFAQVTFWNISSVASTGRKRRRRWRTPTGGLSSVYCCLEKRHCMGHHVVCHQGRF